jgi:hypothetical protein
LPPPDLLSSSLRWPGHRVVGQFILLILCLFLFLLMEGRLMGRLVLTVFLIHCCPRGRCVGARRRPPRSGFSLTSAAPANQSDCSSSGTTL